MSNVSEGISAIKFVASNPSYALISREEMGMLLNHFVVNRKMSDVQC